MLTREERGKIVEAYDKAQAALDRAQAAVLTACKSRTRTEAANGLLREVDMAADYYEGHRKRVGEWLDALMEDSP